MTVEIVHFSPILDYSSSLSVILVNFLLCLMLMFTVLDMHMITILGHITELRVRV